MDATFTLAFARGTVTAPMTLHEVLPTESLTLQRGKGRISSGTGAYARARGSVEGGGFLEFTDDRRRQRALLRGAPEVMRNYLVELQLPSADAASLAVAGERARVRRRGAGAARA